MCELAYLQNFGYPSIQVLQDTIEDCEELDQLSRPHLWWKVKAAMGLTNPPSPEKYVQKCTKGLTWKMTVELGDFPGPWVYD